MSAYQPRPTNKRDISPADAKARVLELIANGDTVDLAMAAVGRKKATYLDWRKHDEVFRAEVDSIREAKAELEETGRPAVPGFPEFCAEWLKEPLFPHQMRAWEVIQGKTPEMHPSMNYDKGAPDRVLMNFPPDHAKSTTFTVNMVVWLIHKNPTINIVIISQSANMAERFLGEIKFKLTDALYRDMHMRFAPEGGWKDKDRSWTNTAIYVQGKDGRKDPTVLALGLSGQIYGARADVIIMDDIITTKNNREIEKQMTYLNREVSSRLPARENYREKRLPEEFPATNLLLVLGTRVAPIDLYRELMEVKNFYGEPVWTYFRQPAVLDYGDGTPDSWTCLWPERYSGPSLASLRTGEASWALIYQQLNVTDEMTFKAEAVEASVNGGRFAGPMTKEGVHHRERGMDGLYVIAGLDPATNGATAMIVMGYDPETQKRWVLDGYNKLDCKPHEMRGKIEYFTELYGVQEWVIERNAYQRSITQDRDLINYLRRKGCKLTEHTTTANKFDSDFGIATMGPIFESCGEPDPKNLSGYWKRTPNRALIDLPSKSQNSFVADLVQQLVVWQPEGMAQKQKTDLVMALWFCEIAVKRIIQRGRKKTYYRDSPFMTQAQMGRRVVIDLADIKRQRQEAEMEGIA